MTTVQPVVTNEILKLIAETDEFRGRWRALKTLVKRGLIAQRGKGRGAHYTLVS